MPPTDRLPRRGPFLFRSGIVGALFLGLSAATAGADDGEIVKRLKDKGAEVGEAKGAVTTLSIPAAAKLTDDDFEQIGRLTHLRSLSFSDGLTDARLELLVGLAELEYLQTNLMQVTDDGLKPLAQLKSLRNVKFFHPGKSFSGAGLAHLSELPKLDHLTVAGSFEFNDAGMAAVAKLTKLEEFRLWHAGPTDEGIKKLKELPKLKSLYLGQRLTYKPPACPTDDTVAVVAEIKSLESLQLDETRLSLTALQQLSHLPVLKKLTLGGVDISPENVERLKKDLPTVKVDWTAPNEAYLKRIHALFAEK